MEFINKGGPFKIRIGEPGKGCYWKTVQTGEVLDLDRVRGKKLGLYPVTTQGKIGDRTVETKQFKSNDEAYIEELIHVRGIGRKTAADIYLIYPSKKKLIEAIKEKKKLPFRDDVEIKLRNKYG